MRISADSKLLFIGDSITDCGRQRPVGRREGLGTGYVRIVEALLSAIQPGCPVNVLNTGTSGNRVTDLRDRWASDVLDLQPDWLAVMIGINDVWRQFDDPMLPDQVTLDMYETTYRELLERTLPTLKGLVLMTPYYIELNRRDPMRAMMDAYSAVVKRLADDYGAVFVDVQEAFDRHLAHRPTQSLCGDRVHPNLTGHTVIACAFLKAIGLALP